jgi:hypothetical protein
MRKFMQDDGVIRQVEIHEERVSFTRLWARAMDGSFNVPVQESQLFDSMEEAVKAIARKKKEVND